MVSTSLEFLEEVVCSEVCVTLISAVMGALDREVTINVAVQSGSATGEG